jgi:hypothetical protein
MGDATDKTVQNLQTLGDLLERSKVRPDTIPPKFFGKIGQGVKRMTAGNQLAYLMTHSNSLDGVIKYLRNVGPAAVAVAQTGNLTQPTHRWNPASHEIESLPITP